MPLRPFNRQQAWLLPPTLGELLPGLVDEMQKAGPRGEKERFATIAARGAVNLALNGKLPKYVKMQNATSQWQLIVAGDPPLTVATGDLTVVDRCHVAHVRLIQEHRKEATTQSLAALAKELRHFLNVLKNELDKATERRIFLETTCFDCPR